MAKKSNITKSEKLQSVYNKLNIKDEEVLYLTIKREFFNRILNGTKKVEFRDNADYYWRKIANFGKKNEYVDDKPLKYILLQAGYEPTSPRLLVEFLDYGWVNNVGYTDKGKICTSKKIGFEKQILIEASNEGFILEDEYIALVLGNILYNEEF